MMHSETPPAQIAAVHADAPAERVFFAQYRLWMAGYCARDKDYWDCALAILRRFAAPAPAKILHAKFRLFTQTLTEQSRREILWRFSGCRCLCGDEFLVLRLMAASQRKDARAETLTAPALLGSGDIEALIYASRSLAGALKDNSLTFAPIERLPIVACPAHPPHSYTLQ
ncbi:hypothetical protein QEV83_15920 [Methylocapsa sp. D3K7]|uniref:hypothetical protein n=1 Tax=Methylocapsa sp. D3K7 TaxID=3041435 RepID=UPI00244E8C1F|nr:hypothetical protein [Methylocapsa sp. D3K7]WGJ14123.1 hypothetical protein QEV83_15920 [Methylocapsa sp. D3K7]